MRARINWEDVAGGRRAVITGDLDIASEQLLRDEFTQAIESCDKIVLDLSGVEWMDSVGLHVIATSSEFASDAGTRFVLGAISDPVRRILEQAKVLDLFEFEPS